MPITLKAVLALFFTLAANAAPPPAAYDPVRQDPVKEDAKFPERLAGVFFLSEGQRCNAMMYVAAGENPKKTVVFLHGMPGMDGNRDLVRVLQRAGCNVLFSTYRGAWGSGGDFSYANALADTHAAVAFLRSEKVRMDYHIDPEQIVLLGHSFGGWVALMEAASDPTIHEVVSIAGWNAAVDAAEIASDPEKKAAFLADLATDIGPAEGMPWRAPSVEALGEELIAAGGKWDFTAQAPALKGRRLLLVTGLRDTDVPPAKHHEPMMAALDRAGAKEVRSVSFDDGHGFVAHRIALAELLVKWLAGKQGSDKPVTKGTASEAQIEKRVLPVTAGL